MPNPALTFVLTTPKDNTPDELYNRFYSTEHLPKTVDFVARQGHPPLALRYKNANPDSPRGQYLAMLPHPDTDYFTSAREEREQFSKDARNSKVLGTDINERVDFTFRRYEKIQTFEGYGHTDKSGTERGQTLVCVAMEPGPTPEQEEDFDDWYRKQHLDMLSMCRGYRRTTRYKRLDEQKPRYLALHEYACAPDELPNDQIQQVTATEWTQKILAEAQKFERDVWQLIEVQGDESLKL